MGIISVHDMQELLGWADIREQRKVGDNNGQQWVMRIIEIMPTHRKRPSICFYFDDAITRLDNLEFSGWHSHYGEVDDALVVAADLIQRRLCVLEAQDARGRYIAGQLCDPTTKPRVRNGTSASKFVRYLFDRDPIDIPYTEWR